jgi:hypothetical protein
LKAEIPLALGFAKPAVRHPFAHPTAFGAPGSGGSFAFADPHAQIGYAYFPNQMGTYLVDPREVALRTAVYRSIGIGDTTPVSELRRPFAPSMAD